MNMAGRPVCYKGSLSRNVIRIFNTDIMTAGLVSIPSGQSEKEDYEVISHSDKRGKCYRKLIFRQDRLAGMVLLNRIEQGGLLMSLIQSGMPVRTRRHALLSPRFSYSQLPQVIPGNIPF